MEAIKQLRIQKGLTQQALARQANISQPYLCGVENGSKRPSLITLIKLSAALGCTIDELVSGNKNTPREGGKV